MRKVNQSENKEMPTQKVDIFAVITDQQSAKLVDPGEGRLTGETLVVDQRIEQALSSSLGLLAIAGIFGDVGDKAVIDADFASITGIESAIGVEKGANNGQAQPFHLLEGGLKMDFQTKTIMMVARYDPHRSQYLPLAIGNGQNIAGWSALAPLVGHAFTAFLGDGVAAIQVQVRQLQVMADRLNTLLPNALQAAVRTPFLPMVVDGLPTDLFFSGLDEWAPLGSCAH
jgi:hypothetical protein